ncbi:MAG: hypothetical protein QW156_04390 [Candidatus Aenigmatarchaeota archaeon]
MIEFKKIPFYQAKEIFTRYHYLGYLSRASSVNLAVYQNKKFIGCVSLHFSPQGIKDKQTIMLSRFWLKYNEKNLASKVLGRLIKYLKINYKQYRRLISYACSCMHEGTIYKASNFKFVGISKAPKDNRSKRFVWRKKTKPSLKTVYKISTHYYHDKLKFEYVFR